MDGGGDIYVNGQLDVKGTGMDGGTDNRRTDG